MGNCLPLFFHQHPNEARLLHFHNRDLENDTKLVEKVVNIPSFNGNKILPYIEPQLQLPVHVELGNGETTCNEESRFVKIKVTRKQLKSMLRNGEQIQVGDIAVRFYEKSREEDQEGSAKWRPSLATIPEVEVRSF